MEVFFIKLGGSILTDKTKAFSLREDVLDRLAREIAEAKKQLPEVAFLIGNGGGSFGHSLATQYEVKPKTKNVTAFSEIHDSVAELNMLLNKAFLKYGLDSYSLAPSSCFNGSFSFLSEQIHRLWDRKITPVIYGDILMTEEGFEIFSTERLFNGLIEENTENSKYKISKVFMVGEVSGVAKNFKENPEEIFEEITNSNFEEIKHAFMEKTGLDVTGGMLHKIEECLKIGQYGISTVILSGLVENRLKNALLGEEVKKTIIKYIA